MSQLQELIHDMTFRRLSGKRLWWSKRVRIFCDGGVPIFRWVPRFRRLGYDPHWGMVGFAAYWLGREFNISLGLDRNGFYGR